jgi:hypothetical protein
VELCFGSEICNGHAMGTRPLPETHAANKARRILLYLEENRFSISASFDPPKARSGKR